jgi:hypothetical protein
MYLVWPARQPRLPADCKRKRLWWYDRLRVAIVGLEGIIAWSCLRHQAEMVNGSKNYHYPSVRFE